VTPDGAGVGDTAEIGGLAPTGGAWEIVETGETGETGDTGVEDPPTATGAGTPVL